MGSEVRNFSWSFPTRLGQRPCEQGLVAAGCTEGCARGAPAGNATGMTAPSEMGRREALHNQAAGVWLSAVVRTRPSVEVTLPDIVLSAGSGWLKLDWFWKFENN